MLGKEMLKIEESVEKLAKMHYFQISPQILINEGNFWLKNMYLRAFQPFRDRLDMFSSTALEKWDISLF